MLRIFHSEDRVPTAEAKALCLSVRAKLKLTQGQLAKRLRVKRKRIEDIEQERYDTVARGIYDALRRIGEERGEE